MSQYLTLLRVMMRPGTRKGAARKKGSSKGAILFAVIVLAVCFGFSFGMMGYAFGMMAHPARAAASIYTLALVVAQGLLLVFGVIYLLSVMYFSRDNEFLLSLPVKSGTVFLAKLTAVYLYLLVGGTFGILTFGIPFGVTAGLSAGFYLMFVPTALLLPLAPIFIATLLSFPLMYLVSFFKRSRILMTVLVVAAVGAFAGLYIWLFLGSGIYDSPEVDAEVGSGGDIQVVLPEKEVDALDNATKYIFFDRCLANLGIESKNVALDLASLFGSHIAFAGITYLLSVSLYRRGMAKQLESGGEVITKNREYRAASPAKALVVKELRNIYRQPILLFYGLLEMVLPIVFLLIFSRSFVELAATGGAVGGLTADIFVQTATLCMALLFGMLFACGTNYVALTSISREGKNFYLMKTLPVPILKQLDIKGYIAYALPVLSLLVVAVWMAAIGAVSVFSAICYFVFMCVLAYGMTFFQVGLDIKKPRLDYDNFAQIMQNNTNGLVCMGINFLFSLAAIVLSVGAAFLTLYINNLFLVELLLWAVLLVLAGLTAYLFRKSYLKKTVLRFDRIEP